MSHKKDVFLACLQCFHCNFNESLRTCVFEDTDFVTPLKLSIKCTLSTYPTIPTKFDFCISGRTDIISIYCCSAPLIVAPLVRKVCLALC